MHHGRADEREFVFAEVKFIALFHDYSSVRKLVAEIGFHHSERRGGRNYLRVFINARELRYISRMVGFHMQHDEIIGSSAA